MDSTATLSFLQAVLPPTGRYCMGVLYPSGAFTNEPCDTLPQLAEALRRADANGNEAYMALAAFGPSGAPQPPTMRNWKGLRTEDNATAMRSLWMDIDVSPEKAAAGKGYATRADAGAALESFLGKTQLPQPMIVSSGGGLHCYWPFTEAIPSALWRKAANALKALCIGMALLVDPTRTADAASVLRPIGTHNHKLSTPRPVQLLADREPYSDEALIANLVAASAPYRHLLNAPAPLKPRPPTDEPLFANAPAHVHAMSRALPPPAERERPRAVPIVKGCQQIAEAGLQSEPVWHKMISVVRLAKDGERMVHALSALDETRYHPGDTQRKIDQAEDAQGGEGMPATCATFNVERPGVCQSCPHWGRIRSPIVLGMGPAPEHIVIDALAPVSLPPAPVAPAIDDQTWQRPNAVAALEGRVIEYNTFQFQLTPQGIIHISKETDPEGQVTEKRQLLTSQRIYPTSCSWERNDSKEKVFTWHFRIHASAREINDYRFRGSDLHDVAGMVKKLGDAGVIVQNSKHFMLIGNYMRGYAETARDQLPMVESAPAMGWTDNNEFILGDRYFRPDGSQLPAARNDKTAALAQAMRTKGDFEKWKAAANIMLRAGLEKYLYCFAQGFAAPLAKFTEAKGFIVHMHGMTGGGKSTVQNLVNAIWGDPEALMLQQPGSKTGATVNSTMQHMVRMNNLPVCAEEITNFIAEDMSDFVYVTSGGRDRMRLSSSAVLKEAMTWHTFVLTSGNTSIRAKIASTKSDLDAEMMRFFEIPMADGEGGTQEADQAALLAIKNNFGHAGGVYAAFLTVNHDLVHARVAARISEYVRKVSASQRERYWMANIACVEVGLELAAAAGIIDYTAETRERLRGYIVSMILQQRSAVTDSRSSRAGRLGDILNRGVPNTLVVQSSREPRKDDAAALAEYAIMKPKGELSIRIEKSTGYQFISHSWLKAQCKMDNTPFADLMAEIRKEGLFVGTPASDPEKVRVRLGRGIPEYEDTPSVLCIRIRSNKMVIALGGIGALDGPQSASTEGKK